MKYLKDWSGIISVILLITGMQQDISAPSALTVAILSAAASAYALCWYNFGLVVKNFNGLASKQAFAISIVGVISTFSATINFGISGPAGLLFLGLAMIGVAWGILKSQLLPDGFMWLSGIIGATTILLGVTGGTSNIGTASIYLILLWTISMSILFIVWGHLPERKRQ